MTYDGLSTRIPRDTIIGALAAGLAMKMDRRTLKAMALIFVIDWSEVLVRAQELIEEA